jgi:predicted transposase YdaD
MPKPFDAATKYLVERQPADWLEYLGFPRGPVTVIEADLSTVTAAADRVLQVEEPDPWLLHLELQSSYDRDLVGRMLEYHVLLWRRTGLGVRTAVVLLRSEADQPALTGRFDLPLPEGDSDLGYSYRVVRIWERPVEELLTGGLGTLPLAPLAKVEPAALPGVVRRMEERIEREAAPAEAGALWTATYVLMGLRYPRELTATLLRGVRAMKESVTYQAILEEGREVGLELGREIGREEGREEGRVQEARALLLRLGERRFGPPSAEVQAAVAAVATVERLEALSEQLLDAESWEELLAG